MRIVFLFLTIIFAQFASAYQTPDFKISAKGTTSSLARQNAIAAGYVTALKEILPGFESDISRFSSSEIEELVADFQIKNEVMSNKNYRAIMNVSFDKELLDEFLTKHHIDPAKIFISYTPSEAVSTSNNNRVLIIPVSKIEKDTVNSNDSQWYRAMGVEKDLLAQHNYIILEDMDEVSDMNLMSVSYNNIKNLLDKYQARKAIIVLAEYLDDRKFEVIKISLFRKDIEDDNLNQGMVRIGSVKGENIDELNRAAVTEVINSFKARKKAQKIFYADEGKIDVVAYINDIATWREIEHSLKRIKFITKVIPKEISDGRLVAEITFFNDIEGLERALRKVGLAIAKVGDEYILVRG